MNDTSRFTKVTRRGPRECRSRCATWLSAGALLTAFTACRRDDFRHGHVRLDGEAVTATLSGVAGGTEPAAEVVDGCVGFVADPDVPDQIVELSQASKIDLTARSPRGPVTLVVVGEDGGGCDDDHGSGHAPTLRIVAPGTYRVWVAAREPGRSLPYELSAALDDKARAAQGGEPAVAGRGGARTVSVSVTSDTPGAEVRTSGGQVLGVTPALFEYTMTDEESRGPLSFFVALPGRAPVRVEGTPRDGQLVLHASSTGPWNGAGAGGSSSTAPGERIASSASVRIRDRSTATQSATYGGDCVIASLDVTVDIRHTYPRDLRVQLRSPSGTLLTLQSHANRQLAPRTFTWRDTRALQRLAGEQARGDWSVIVRDDADIDVGTFESFQITFQCQEAALPPRLPTSTVGVRDVLPRGAHATVPVPAPPPTIHTSRRTSGNGDMLDPWGSPPSSGHAPSTQSNRNVEEHVNPWK